MLAASLHDFAEIDESALRHRADLLREFALGDRERVFALPVLALRERPGAVILLRPKWSARMHEQELERAAAASIDQQSSASLRHVNLRLCQSGIAASGITHNARLRVQCPTRHTASGTFHAATGSCNAGRAT